MPPLLTDEDFNGRIIRGLLLRLPELDLVRAVEIDLGSTHDRLFLARAAEERRVLLTHDVSTMGGFAVERIEAGFPMAGMIAVQKRCPIGRAIEDILAFLVAGGIEDWTNRIEFVPL
jgi:hypothetical protein